MSILGYRVECPKPSRGHGGIGSQVAVFEGICSYLVRFEREACRALERATQGLKLRRRRQGNGNTHRALSVRRRRFRVLIQLESAVLQYAMELAAAIARRQEQLQCFDEIANGDVFGGSLTSRAGQ